MREEMVAEKGLPGPVADKIGTLVQVRGTMGGKGGLNRRREDKCVIQLRELPSELPCCAPLPRHFALLPFLWQLKGRPLELLGRLTSERTFGDHAGAAAALAELGLLFRYLDAMG